MSTRDEICGANYDRVLTAAGKRGLYESHYLKANAPTGEGALWLKYGFLTPKDPSEPSVAEIWVVVWQRPRTAPLVLKEVFPTKELVLDAYELGIDGKGFRLSKGHASGELTSASHRVRWDFALLDPAPALVHFPYAALYEASFPKKKILSPAPKLRLAGVLEVDGRPMQITDWIGFRGHNWGSEHAFAYAYGNCALWSDPALDWLLDAFTAKVRLGPLRSPWLSLAVGRMGGHEVAWNAPSKWLARSARVEFPTWSFALEERGRRIEAQWRGHREDMAGLRYRHPDGRISYCYNTKFAELNVTVREAGRVRTASSQAAELEFLFADPILGIPLYG